MEIKYLEEIKLKFGNNIESFNPQIGLLKGGPFGPHGDEETSFKIISCGIIGTYDSIAHVKNLIDNVHLGLKSEDTVYGKIGFPGLGPNSPLQFSLRIMDHWISPIFDLDLKNIKAIPDFNIKKNNFIDLFEQKIQNITNIDPPPDIIFIALNQDILDIFKRYRIIKDDIIFSNRNEPDTVYESNGDINFHNIIKILGMKYGIPTQLLKPTTLFLKPNEDKVTTIWNLIVGLYYKDKGIPWKFSYLDNQVCYVGISFYRDFSLDEVFMNTSLAQVFLYTGESFILRGESFEWKRTKQERNPHLDVEKSKDIINKILDLYFQQKGNNPKRLVIYKTSNFHDEEIEGFYQNERQIREIDMITINPRPKLKLFRYSKYPPLRGTMLKFSKAKKCFLYTNGFIPVLETYPGMRSPNPLEITAFNLSVDLENVCREILTLTRLDWNNVKYCQNLPVTIAFSQKIGHILSEKRARDIEIQHQYRYYM